jgi:uncharacterized membrane protein
VFDTIFGLPIHPLVVHGTVVAVPLACLLVAATACWPRLRAKLAWPAALTALVATALTAAAALSGGPLARRLPESAVLATHERNAKILAVCVVLLSAAGLALAYVSWRRSGAPVVGWLPAPDRLRRAATPAVLAPLVARRWVLAGVVAASLVASAGTMVEVVIVGHTGATAAWSGVMQAPPPPRGHGRER